MNYLFKIKNDLIFIFILFSIGITTAQAEDIKQIPDNIFNSLSFVPKQTMLVDSKHLLITGRLEDYRGVSFPLAQSRLRSLKINDHSLPWWRIIRGHKPNPSHAYKEVSGILKLLGKKTAKKEQAKDKPGLSRLLATGAEIHVRKKGSGIVTFIPKELNSSTEHQGILVDAFQFMETIETKKFSVGFIVPFDSIKIAKEINLEIQFEIIYGKNKRISNSINPILLASHDVEYLHWVNGGKTDTFLNQLKQFRTLHLGKKFKRLAQQTSKAFTQKRFETSSLAAQAEIIYLNSIALMKNKQSNKAQGMFKHLLKTHPFSIYATKGLFHYNRLSFNQVLNSH